MNNILILASGSVARHFIEWISKNRVAQNHYFVTCYKRETTPDKMSQNITIIDADPTSYSKLNRIMSNTKFYNVFIVMEDLEDTTYALKNVTMINSKIRVVVVNQWGDEALGEGRDNIKVVNSHKLVASYLYDKLPSVPLIAQNIGLGQGEIMEIRVPFGSSYAYRHIGSILQRKWKIVALYRDDKQILPNSATMVRPNDILLIVGKPMVLDGVYKTINKIIGLFPEPFGKDIYLILDFRFDQDKALRYINESIYLIEKLKKKSLFIRILYPNNFKLISQIRELERDNITLTICYKNEDIKPLIEYDINMHNIGLVMSSIPSFDADNLGNTLYNLRKLVFIFGDRELVNIEKSIVLMSQKEKMESISSTAFDISQTLDLELNLCDFDPDGDFDSKNMIIEHYETLAQIFKMELSIEQKVANPIREITAMEDILQIAPFEDNLNRNNFLKLLSSRVQDFILTTTKHPKLLVPFAIFDG